MNKLRSNLLSSPPDWTPRGEEVGPRPGTPRYLPWYPGREGRPGKTIGLFKVGFLFIIPYSNI